MADTPAIQSLALARERTIEALTARFAADDLTMDELERRLELAYRAANVVELHALVADLEAAVAVPGGVAAARSSPLEQDTVATIFGAAERLGAWVVAERVDVRAAFGTVVLDLTEAVMPNTPVVDVHIRTMFSTVKLIVPPGMRVVNRLGSVLATVAEDEADLSPMDQSLPVVRLTGWAFLATVKSRTRRREAPLVLGARRPPAAPSSEDEFQQIHDPSERHDPDGQQRESDGER